MLSRLLVAFTLALAVTQALAADTVLDLNGFRLWQLRAGVEKFFPPPFEALHKDGSDSEFLAYKVTDDSYMLFGYWNKFKHNIYSAQITGYPTKMLPFKGLVLGDGQDKVLASLGKPDRTEKIKDPDVTVWRYDASNYSVEVDAQGKLYSIKVWITAEIMELPKPGFDFWTRFRDAVLARDQKALLQALRPDVEIYRSGQTLSIERRMADFEAQPDKTFMAVFFGDKGSVRDRILNAKRVEHEQRLNEHLGIGSVVKFYDDPVLREIAFFPYNGQLRVYEVAFREKNLGEVAPAKDKK